MDKSNYVNSLSNFSFLNFALLTPVPFPWLSSLVLDFGASMGGKILTVLTDGMVVSAGIVMRLGDVVLMQMASLEETSPSSVQVKVVIYMFRVMLSWRFQHYITLFLCHVILLSPLNCF